MVDIKEKILSTATLRMQQVGIRSVSIDDLCHELGISKKTFYVHFSSKEDLVAAILITQEEKLKKDVQHLVEKKSVVQCIIDWTKIAKKTEKQRHQAPPMLYDLQKYYPSIHNDHRIRVRSIIQEFLIQFLQKGQNEGIFRLEIDIEATAMLFVNAQVMMMEHIEAQQLSTAERRLMSRNTMDILLRGVFTVEGLNTLIRECEN